MSKYGRAYRTLWTIALIAFVLVASLACALVVGVPDELKSVYTDAERTGHFQCLDQSKTIPFSAVNDDYCDCPDGSDEPGTSACVGLNINGVMRNNAGGGAGFQCVNTGFKAQSISQSKVADGLCDCCDGSDEVNTVDCPNVCATVEKEHAARAKEEAKMRAKATAAKTAMKAKAEKHRASVAAEIPKLEANITGLEAELSRLEGSLVSLEAQQTAKREELRQVHDAWIATHAASSKQQSNAICVGWRQTGKCKPDGPLEPDHDKDCDELIPDIASGYCECIPDGDGSDSESGPAEAAKNIRHGFTCKHAALTCAYVCSHGGVAGLRDEVPPEGTTYILPELAEQRKAIETMRKDIEAARATLKKNRETLSHPLGTEDLLRTLTGESFTLDHQDYTYELVLFSNTYQHNKGKKGGPSLGKWKQFAESTYSSWAKDAFDLSQMVYADGYRCWNGIVRATDVHVVCGAENRLALIEEPSMCKYKMVFETPAMCEE